MADALDVHWTTLSRWERGLSEPRLQQLWEIAHLYLDSVLRSDGAVTGIPENNTKVPRAAIFCDEQGSRGVDWFVRDALTHGELVNIVLPGETRLPGAWSGLTAGAPVPREALRSGQVRQVPLERFCVFTRGRLEMRRTIAALVREEQEARERGFPGVAWVTDCREALRRPEFKASIFSLETLTDCLAQGGGTSRGVVLYPSGCRNTQLLACLVCCHQWVVSEAGPVQNAFHRDPNLCLARLIKEASNGAEQGNPGEEVHPQVRPICPRKPR